MADLITRSDTGTTTTVELRGDFDVGAADDLRHALVDTIMRHRPDHLVIDLRGVTFMDSTGIGTLVAAYQTACDLDVAFTVAGPSPFLARVLATSGLHQLLAPPPLAGPRDR